MSISEKIKTINNKIEQNKDQYDLERHKILALLSGNVNKYEVLTSKDVLRENRLARRSCHIRKI